MAAITILFENHAGWKKGLIGYHGFSALVEHNEYRVLVDTGTDGRVLLNNMRELGVEPDSIDALFLTHGHYDHTGGMVELLKARSEPLDVYAHPGIFARRVALKPRRREIGIPFIREELEALGAVFHLSEKPFEFLPGFISSGEIERKTWDMAVGYLVEGVKEIKDPVKDDIALILDLGRKVAVITGCGHSGILNIARHAVGLTGKPITALIGGFHLRGAPEHLLDDAVKGLKELGVERLYAGHCTGIDEYAYLKGHFELAEPLFVGKEIRV
ncbi:MBL fold metallo-hydrolase [Thermococcus stetteri]|uniref:MBL fold metallo-hydrolase n=1 Tax=Thermococcus stetteri TaxID=49900 RepID=UPI001AE12181|nr:MBL fold metallo-hydrolase [Thermococcus stetteri]MBP1912952.1 7,8-dihydropterin-6-yl-methyl-4-(beta-D-ribofuranosyl)aminobenzene 5'-phosphate synthase [Thermococcus stetteri]